MADSARELLRAAETALKASAALTALVGARVYGAVPEKPTYPYVFISCSSVPFDADDMQGMEHTLRVQGFTRENKPGTALAIREAVYAALNRKEVGLALPNNETVLVDFDGMADCFPEEDGRSYQSIIEFKVLVQ